MNARTTAIAAMTLLVLGGCGQSGGSIPEGVTAAQAQACRERTDEVFLRQNRSEIYRADSYVAGSRDTPMSGGTNPANVGSLGAVAFSDGIGGQFARARSLNDCYRSVNTGGTLGSGPTAAPTKP